MGGKTYVCNYGHRNDHSQQTKFKIKFETSGENYTEPHFQAPLLVVYQGTKSPSGKLSIAFANTVGNVQHKNYIMSS